MSARPHTWLSSASSPSMRVVSRSELASAMTIAGSSSSICSAIIISRSLIACCSSALRLLDCWSTWEAGRMI